MSDVYEKYKNHTILEMGEVDEVMDEIARFREALKRILTHVEKVPAVLDGIISSDTLLCICADSATIAKDALTKGDK